MTDKDAAIKAGYAESTACNPTQNIDSQGLVKEAMEKVMERKGLTDDYLIDKTKEGLEKANKIHGTNDNFVEVPDYQVRHRYLETALKMKGKLELDSNKQPVNVTVNIKDYGEKNDKEV